MDIYLELGRKLEQKRNKIQVYCIIFKPLPVGIASFICRYSASSQISHADENSPRKKIEGKPPVKIDLPALHLKGTIEFTKR